MKNIDEASNKDLYIELESKKGQQHQGKEETNKRTDKKFVAKMKKKWILIGTVKMKCG